MDPTPGHVQAFRSVHKSQKPSTISAPLDSDDVTLIDCHTDPDTNKDFILWEDIQQVFDEALFIRDKTKMVAFLKGPDYRTLEPRRIAAVSGVVLDVVVGGELVPAVAIPTPTPTTTPIPLPLLSALQKIGHLSEQYPKYDPISALRTPSRITIPRTQNRQPPEKVTQQALAKQLALKRVKNVIKTLTANVDLESLHSKGDGSPEDFTKALECYLKAVGQGHAQAQFSVGDLFTRGKEVPQNSSMAMVWYLLAAEHGHMEAQFKVAKAYEEGSDGVSQHHTMAIQWFLKAAEQGNGDAQVALGDRYRGGRGVNRNSRIAMNWYLKAAEQNHAHAQFMIGLLHCTDKRVEQALYPDNQGNGESVKGNSHDFREGDDDDDIPKGENEDEAMEWFLNAAHQGLADAQFAVACLLYYRSKDPYSIPHHAAAWCLMAANQNHVPAQLYTGNFCLQGKGRSSDGTRASEWFLKVIGQTGGRAEWGLGMVYHLGLGDLRDYSKAFEWYLKGAEQGHSESQYQVAQWYEKGWGISMSREKAIEWYTKAEHSGHCLAGEDLEILLAK